MILKLLIFLIILLCHYPSDVHLFAVKHRVRADVVYSGPASLGMACLADAQCQLVDPYTRCLNKRCDCAFGNNSTSSCSARNRGCLPGTFQVRNLNIQRP